MSMMNQKKEESKSAALPDPSSKSSCCMLPPPKRGADGFPHSTLILSGLVSPHHPSTANGSRHHFRRGHTTAPSCCLNLIFLHWKNYTFWSLGEEHPYSPAESYNVTPWPNHKKHVYKCILDHSGEVHISESALTICQLVSPPVTGKKTMRINKSRIQACASLSQDVRGQNTKDAAQSRSALRQKIHRHSPLRTAKPLGQEMRKQRSKRRENKGIWSISTQQCTDLNCKAK